MDGERLYGRGVLDTKGGLAAAMLVAASFADGELAGDLIVAAVADEESGSIGTEALVREWSADGAVVLEPTDLQVIASHRGFAVVEATVRGRATHTSRADRGANAVHEAVKVVTAVQALDAAWAAGDPDPVCRPTVMVNRLHSESELFTVPARCALTIEMRTTGSAAEQQVRQVIDAVRAASPAVVECSLVMQRAPLAQPADHLLATALQRAAAQNDVDSTVAAAPYWTDAALHSGVGTPAVVFGPSGEGLHEDVEWVTIDSQRRCEATLRTLARQWCGPGQPGRPGRPVRPDLSGTR
ncbi:MAG: M20/M25/M40 family metallo-hydrolase [Actinomycetota bacterium]|nr:M20/M25/M40 family metallo-hydrolase [Actinomycetota bacterium]